MTNIVTPDVRDNTPIDVQSTREHISSKAIGSLKGHSVKQINTTGPVYTDALITIDTTATAAITRHDGRGKSKASMRVSRKRNKKTDVDELSPEGLGKKPRQERFDISEQWADRTDNATACTPRAKCSEKPQAFSSVDFTAFLQETSNGPLTTSNDPLINCSASMASTIRCSLPVESDEDEWSQTPPPQGNPDKAPIVGEDARGSRGVFDTSSPVHRNGPIRENTGESLSMDPIFSCPLVNGMWTDYCDNSFVLEDVWNESEQCPDQTDTPSSLTDELRPSSDSDSTETDEESIVAPDFHNDDTDDTSDCTAGQVLPTPDTGVAIDTMPDCTTLTARAAIIHTSKCKARQKVRQKHFPEQVGFLQMVQRAGIEQAKKTFAYFDTSSPVHRNGPIRENTGESLSMDPIFSCPLVNGMLTDYYDNSFVLEDVWNESEQCPDQTDTPSSLTDELRPSSDSDSTETDEESIVAPDFHNDDTDDTSDCTAGQVLPTPDTGVAIDTMPDCTTPTARAAIIHTSNCKARQKVQQKHFLEQVGFLQMVQRAGIEQAKKTFAYDEAMAHQVWQSYKIAGVESLRGKMIVRSKEMYRAVLRHVFQHPEDSIPHIVNALATNNVNVSPTTVDRFLHACGIRSPKRRATAVQQLQWEGLGAEDFVQKMEKNHVEFKKKHAQGKYSKRVQDREQQKNAILEHLLNNRDATAQQVATALKSIYPALQQHRVKRIWQSHGLNQQERTRIVNTAQGNKRIFFQEVSAARARYVETKKLKKLKTPGVTLHMAEEVQMAILRHTFQFPKDNRATVAHAVNLRDAGATSIGTLWRACNLTTEPQRSKSVEEAKGDEELFLQIAQTHYAENSRAVRTKGSKRKTPALTFRMSEETQTAVLRYTFQHPEAGRDIIADTLQLKHASAKSIEKLWKACNLGTQPQRNKSVEEANENEELFVQTAKMHLAAACKKSSPTQQ